MSYIEFTGSEVIIMTCSDCNTRCKHCYIGYQGNFDGEELFELCQKLKKYKIFLNGTEILLHPEYFKSLQAVGQNSLITNGLALKNNPSLIDELVRYGIDHVDVSYHFGIHGEISHVSLTDILNVISSLKQAGIDVKIRTTVDARNVDKVKLMCDTAHSWGANGIKFTNMLHTGQASGLDDKSLLTAEQLQRFLRDIEEQRARYDIKEFRIRRCGSFGPAPCSKFYCPAGNQSVVITPELKVYPCVFLAKKGMEIGYVDNGRIMVNDFINDHSDCIAKQLLNNGAPMSNYFTADAES